MRAQAREADAKAHEQAREETSGMIAAARAQVSEAESTYLRLCRRAAPTHRH